MNIIPWCWHGVLRLLHAKFFCLVTFGNFRTGTVSHSVPGPRTCTGVYWIYRYHDVTNDETIRFVRRITQTVRGIYYLLEVVVRQGSASRWRFENLWRPQLRCFIKWPVMSTFPDVDAFLAVGFGALPQLAVWAFCLFIKYYCNFYYNWPDY